MISEKTHKALCILRDIPTIGARGFAHEMWPDSNIHTKVSNQGNGACHGKAAWLCAGSYIGRLKKMGLASHSIRDNQDYRVTDEGHQAIKEYEGVKGI